MTLTESTSDMICKSGMTADATSGREELWKTLYRMHVCENIHLDICKKIGRYVKDIWIYMDTYYRYIWYEKQGKLFFVIQYQYNAWVNSPWIYINTNSTLLGSSSSLTMTLTETTSDMICKNGMTADATSGRENILKNFI